MKKSVTYKKELVFYRYIYYREYNMRSSVVSLKCMYRGIHKLRTGKGEVGSVQKCTSIVLATSLLSTKVRAGVKNLTYLSVRSL